MINPIGFVADVIRAGGEAFEKLGSVTRGIIEVSGDVPGRYGQKDGETDEAYRMRLEFLKEKDKIREESKIRRKETTSQERLARRELRTLKRQEKKEARISRKQGKKTENRL